MISCIKMNASRGYLLASWPKVDAICATPQAVILHLVCGPVKDYKGTYRHLSLIAVRAPEDRVAVAVAE